MLVLHGQTAQQSMGPAAAQLAIKLAFGPDLVREALYVEDLKRILKSYILFIPAETLSLESKRDNRGAFGDINMVR